MSSAEIKNLQKLSRTSFIKIKNKKGPRWVPWPTPDGMLSIFLLLPLVGVVTSLPTLSNQDNDAFHPIMSRTDERRVCSALCSSGLGGDACGDDCLDLTPPKLPLQLPNSVSDKNNSISELTQFFKPRNSTCPVLCNNNLGFPLCSCTLVLSKTEAGLKKVNFIEICAVFCIDYNYKLFGCQKCDVYKNMLAKTETKYGLGAVQSPLMMSSLQADWVDWCVEKCNQGDGGAACGCDKLPMMT